MYRLLIILFFFVSFGASAQPSDFIVLKKKGKTVRSYYAGTQIEFVSTGGAYRNALVNVIRNDTLYLQEFLVRQIPTTFGTYMLDTAGSFRYAYHYNEIASLGPKAKRGFNMQGSGASLFGGGILLLLGSGVVYLADREKFSPALMGGAAGLAALGYLMMKSGSKGTVIGKKGYSLHYVDMTP
jgi:hypothetical protein